MTTKQISKFQNDAFLEGVVSESDIQLKEFNGQDGKYNALAGRIVIQTGENESHVAQYFVKELKKDGTPNGIFVNVKTVVDDLVTLADIAQGKVDKDTPASKVTVSGEMDLNEYYREGKLHSNVQVKGVFLNRVKDESKYTPRATFDLEGIVGGVSPEIKGDDETGRAIVKVLVPTYSSAIPLSMVTREEDADYTQDNFEIGSTVNLYGNMINFSKKIETKKEGGFGEAKTQVKWDNVRELQITGGDIYSEESPLTLEEEQIKELMAKRNVHLAGLQEKAENASKPKEKTLGFGGNTNVAQTTTKKVDSKIAANLF